MRAHPSPRRWTTVALRAAASRAAVVTFSVACNLAFPDHAPTGAALFHPEKYGGDGGALCGGTSTSASWWVASLSTFTRWDAAHFLSIAERGGYTDEPS